MEVSYVASYLYAFIYEVSYAKGGFMHFVSTKKEVYVICTQKSRTVLRSETILCKRRIYAFRAHKQKEVHVIAEP